MNIRPAFPKQWSACEWKTNNCAWSRCDKFISFSWTMNFVCWFVNDSIEQWILSSGVYWKDIDQFTEVYFDLIAAIRQETSSLFNNCFPFFNVMIREYFVLIEPSESFSGVLIGRSIEQSELSLVLRCLCMSIDENGLDAANEKLLFVRLCPVEFLCEQTKKIFVV